MSGVNKELNIIHFNDVYEVGARSKEPIGGVTRFTSALKKYSDINPITLFSGDVFNPSVLSTTTKGKHMIPIMNHLKVQAAMVGNHEFDFGPNVLRKNIKKCSFPWVMSNVVDKQNGGQLLGTHRLLNIDWNGVKVGIIGLAEAEWVYTTHNIDRFANYIDFVEEGNKLAKELKDGGADIHLIVKLSLQDMRMNNCVKLADNTTGIDLILAGHDHFYELNQSRPIIVSGCDFRNFTIIKATKSNDKWSFDFKRVDVDSSFSEDPEMVAIVKEFSEAADKQLNKVIGTTEVQLDARNARVRTRFSKPDIGNLLTDIMKHEMESDIAFINAGSIRSDDTYGPGDVTLKSLLSVLPYINSIVKIKINGAKLKEVLEAAVKNYPAQDGRFAQLSGIEFEFDPQQPSGNRVQWVKVNGAPLKDDQDYTAASEIYIAKGNDGYECLADCEFIVDEENAPILSTLVRRYFMAMKVLDAFDSKRKTNVVLALEKWSKTKPYSVKPKIEGRIQIKGVTTTQTGSSSPK